jgi:cyclopropane fatty-acyl-phospholipid synthase-like methyltransferase
MNKYEQEDYITIQPNVDVWKNHANVHILDLYKDYVHGDVLDVGCNHGASGTYWISNNINVTSITGLDIQEQIRPIFLDIMKPINLPIHFIQSDFTKEVTLEKTYDTIVSFHALEHIFPEDVTSFVTNMYKHLKTNGSVIISIPYQNAYDDPHHAATYDENTLAEVMESGGFVTVDCARDDRWPIEKDLLTGRFIKT